MRRIPGLCPRCPTDQVMKGGKTTVHICNTTWAAKMVAGDALRRNVWLEGQTVQTCRAIARSLTATGPLGPPGCGWRPSSAGHPL